MSFENAPALVVETGMHRTARCQIRSGRNRVGARDDATIVVSDLKESFFIDRRPNGIFLRATSSAIELRDAKTVKPGQHRLCLDATHFDCGGVSFRLDIPRIPARNLRFFRSRRISTYGGGILAATVLSVFVWSAAASRPERTEPVVASFTSAADVKSTLLATRSPLAPNATETSSIAAELRRHLAAVGLQSVAITQQGAGAIEATGEIAPGDEEAWRKIGQWFDAHAKGRTVLISAVRTVAIKAPLAVRAVWSGSNPYVVDGDGDRLFVGSVLDSGWTIDSIQANRVMLKRGDRSMSVRF